MSQLCQIVGINHNAGIIDKCSGTYACSYVSKLGMKISKRITVKASLMFQYIIIAIKHTLFQQI